ncbi:MAG: hypothetical protein FJX74_14695 [Armatimonadetes bacterium]|nr:hypothetical protein [Armatimonadota bacterium]
MARKREWLPIVAWAVALLLTGTVVFVLMFVLPKFVELFEELGVQEFPLPTLVLMKASRFLMSKWWLVAFVGIVVLALGRKWLGRSLSGRTRVLAPVVLACLGLAAVPLVAWATLLPMLSVTTQVAGP